MTFRFKDVADLVVAEATKRFSPNWKLNEESLTVLEEYCDAFEAFARENDAVGFDFEVDEVSMAVVADTELPEFTSEGGNGILCKLLQRANSFRVSKTDTDNIRVCIEFPSLWNRA